MTAQQKALIEKLSRHPHIEARIMELCNFMDISSGKDMTADAAEELVIKEIKKLGQELLQEWAASQSEKSAAEATAQQGVV